MVVIGSLRTIGERVSSFEKDPNPLGPVRRPGTDSVAFPDSSE